MGLRIDLLIILVYINKINWVLNSTSQIHYPRVFVDINTVDRGKMRNEAHRIDLKNVEL